MDVWAPRIGGRRPATFHQRVFAPTHRQRRPYPLLSAGATGRGLALSIDSARDKLVQDAEALPDLMKSGASDLLAQQSASALKEETEVAVDHGMVGRRGFLPLTIIQARLSHHMRALTAPSFTAESGQLLLWTSFASRRKWSTA